MITVFRCKLQGKRANKARNLVKELIEEDEENNDKNNSSNVTAKQQTQDEIIPISKYRQICL